MSEFRSHFICEGCRNPLYVSEGEADVCLNELCRLYEIGTGRAIDSNEADVKSLAKELGSREKHFDDDIAIWDPDALAREAYEARRRIIEAFFDKGGIEGVVMERFHAINYMLIVNRKRPRSSRTLYLVTSVFEKLVDKAVNMLETKTLLQDIQNRRYAFTDGKSGLQGFALKFNVSYMETLAQAGIVSSDRFMKSFLDGPQNELRERLTVMRSLDELNDWSYRLDDLVELSFLLDKGLKLQQWTSEMYAYRAEPDHMAIVLGWFVGQEPNEPPKLIPYETAKDGWMAQFLKFGMSESHGSFINEFIESDHLAPIAVKSDGLLLIDRVTALFFIVYLYGHAISNDMSLFKRGQPLHTFQTKQGSEFELLLRRRLRSHFEWVADEGVQPTKKGFEYDVVAVSEKSLTIVLIEAKYQDPAPSSYGGRNLVRQELEGRQGILAHAQRHVRRVAQFEGNPEVFRNLVETKRDLSKYKIVGLVITKATPLIYRHSRIEVLSYDKLMNRLEDGQWTRPSQIRRH